MNFHIDDSVVSLLIATFIPQIVATVFVLLCFNRAGYGVIGKLLCAGFCLSVISLATGLMYVVAGPEGLYLIASGVTRLASWCLIAAGFVAWFIELDRSLP